MDRQKDATVDAPLEYPIGHEPGDTAAVFARSFEPAMQLESERFLGAGHCERTLGRQDYEAQADRPAGGHGDPVQALRTASHEGEPPIREISFYHFRDTDSKKAENHMHAVAPHFTYYTFVKIDRTLRIIPAMTAAWLTAFGISLILSRQRMRMSRHRRSTDHTENVFQSGPLPTLDSSWRPA